MMKTINISNKSVVESTSDETNSLGFEDITVYNEMADQTSVKMNLLEQIRAQMHQLEEMSARREFVTRELMTYFSK